MPEYREGPRHRMISARVSPMVELARWLFERYGVAYHEEPHAPMLHVLATLAVGGGVEVPVVVEPEGVWKGAQATLDALDAKSRPGQRLYGESEVERAANRALVATLLGLMLKPVRRFVYHQVLPLKRILYPIATEEAPAWERAFVWWLYPLWRALMGFGLGFRTAELAEAPASIGKALDLVEAELSRRGSTYLGGDAPGATDIIFAALAAPIVFPPQYGSLLPRLEDIPASLRDFILAVRARPAGRLALATYATTRGRQQPPLAMPANGGGIGALLQGAFVQRVAARAAALVGRPIRLKELVIVSRWSDVQAVLDRDLDFRIAPVNAGRIDQVNGPFVLGLDRGRRLSQERPRLYQGMTAVDLPAIQGRVAREAGRLLDDAARLHGRIEVVNGYARRVAARTAQAVFGVSGPTEADFMRVIRAIFHHTFLNLNNDPKVAAIAIAAAVELTAWFDAEIDRRLGLGDFGGDVLGGVMACWPGAHDEPFRDGVRRNVAGLLVGAIDTTATSVAKIVSVATTRPALLGRIRVDLDDPDRLWGWCQEALRLWPHNPLVLRKTIAPTRLGEMPIAAGVTVVAYTQAAMFDERVFTESGTLNPARDPELYLHFSGGLHICAGRAINRVQIPQLVRSLIDRDIGRAGPPGFDGPFIDRLVVPLAPSKAAGPA